MAMAFWSLFWQPRVTEAAMARSEEQSGARSGCTRMDWTSPGADGAGPVCAKMAVTAMPAAAAAILPHANRLPFICRLLCLRVCDGARNTAPDRSIYILKYTTLSTGYPPSGLRLLSNQYTCIVVAEVRHFLPAKAAP